MNLDIEIKVIEISRFKKTDISNTNQISHFDKLEEINSKRLQMSFHERQQDMQ